MRRTRALALALAVLTALPAAAALVPGPAPAAPPPGSPQADLAEPVMFLRRDPDGNRTFILWVEDDPAGTYVYRRAAAPQPNGDVREVGTYTKAWTYQGKPEVTVGLYTITRAEGLVRYPRIIVEHAPDDVGFVNALSAAVLTDVVGSADSLAPFVLETAAPDLGDFTAASLRFKDFVQRPTLVAWYARRALAGADAWLGTYLARDGAVQEVPGGQEGWRSAEFGTVLRQAGQDQRVAGAWVEQRASFTQGAQDRAAYSEFTVGLRNPFGRTPLATVRGDDARAGEDLRNPAAQSSGITIGAHTPLGYMALAGLRTDMEQRFHDKGVEVTRTTAAGVFVQGAWVPVAGTRYHGERFNLLDLPFAMVNGGVLGANNTGDAELSIGAYPFGVYEPVAQVTLDDSFAGARHRHRTMVSVGVFTPVRYQHLASVTYDGTHSLVGWANAVLGDDEKGTEWMVSTGPWAGGLYVPLVGVRFRGDAPGHEQAHEAELAVGAFAGSYPAFVPVAAAHASSDEEYDRMALRLASEGLGNTAGSWQAGAGVYTPTDETFVPLAGVRYRPVQDPESPKSADLDVLVAEQPVVGVQFRGEKAMVAALNNPTNLNDDSAWRATVGAYTPAGFVPLVRVYHDRNGNTVVLGPDVPV